MIKITEPGILNTLVSYILGYKYYGTKLEPKLPNELHNTPNLPAGRQADKSYNQL
jgi:hypothetical protein